LVAAQLEVLAEEKGQLLSTDVLMPIVAEADRVVLRHADAHMFRRHLE